jgi:hypothetical protein
MRRWTCQCGKVAFIFKARHGIVGLGLQKCGLYAALGRGKKTRHAAPVQEVRHERGNEDRLARPSQSGDAQPDNRFKKNLGHAILDIFHLPPNLVGNS